MASRTDEDIVQVRKHLPEYEPGGRSIGFTSSLSLRLRRGDWITLGTGNNKQIIGQVVKYKSHKNKTYKQQQTGEVDFYFDEGGPVPPGHFDNAKELIILAIVYGVIEKKGSWFYYEGNNLAQGELNVVALVRKDEKLFAEIKEKTAKVAYESDIQKEDVFGTDEITKEDLAETIDDIVDDIPVKPKKGKSKK